MLDVLIVSGRVVDGTGTPWYRADLAIQDGKIVEIGRLAGAQAATVIDAAGQVVAPGFADIHSHADHTLLVDPRASSAIRQGVTTHVLGNCGHSPAPLARPEDLSQVVLGYQDVPEGAARWTRLGEYLDALQERRPAINAAALVGHNAVRVAVMGQAPRLATDDEVDRMRRLVAEAMEDGALGLSSGLEYTPGNSSDTREVAALAAEAARQGGFYATHIRQRDYKVLSASQEAVEIAETSGAPLQFSHLPPRVWASRDAFEQMVGLVEAARERGVDAVFDVVVYPIGATTLAAMLPKWVFEGGKREALKRLADPAIRQELRAYRFPLFKYVVSEQWDKLYLYTSQKNPQYGGMTFEEIGRDRRKDPYDAILDLMVEEGEDFYGMMWSADSQDEHEVRASLQHPLCFPESDGLTLCRDGPQATMHHPYTYGWAARVLGKYVREERLLTLEEAIRKLTAYPARRAGLRERGELRPGYAADVVVFDPATIRDNTTRARPDEHPDGVSAVLVNGEVAVRDGRETGVRAGRVLRRG